MKDKRFDRSESASPTEYVPMQSNMSFEAWAARNMFPHQQPEQPLLPVDLAQAFFAQQIAQPQSQFIAANTIPRTPPAESAAAPKVDTPEQRKKAAKKHRRVGRNTLVVAGVVVAAGALVGASNSDVRSNVTSFVQTFIPAQPAVAENGKDSSIVPIDEQISTAGFQSGTCEKPASVLMVAAVNAELPLAPMITKTDVPTPTKAKEYIQDGDTYRYPYATFEDLKLGISACLTDPKGLVKNGDGTYVIDMSMFDIKFQDQNALFDIPFLSATYSAASSTQAPTFDPNKGQYLYYTDPAAYLDPGSDAVYQKSLTDITAAMGTEAQMKAIYAFGEESVKQQIVDVTDGQKDISYPDNKKIFMDAVQNSIAKRLKVSLDQISFIGVDFSYPTIVPPNTTLAGLDPTQKAIIESVKIENGTLSAPVLPTATPTPTPTATPVTGP